MKIHSIAAQIASLRDMPTDALKKKWRELYNSEPPPFNRVYLESRIAYRLQELTYGGLSKGTQRRITELREEIFESKPRQAKTPERPPTGAILVREYQGVEHRVRVLQDGFEYGGRKFRSLSGVATHIAGGTRWNGWEFFGLRRRKL